MHTVIDIKDFLKLFNINKHMYSNIAQYNEEIPLLIILNITYTRIKVLITIAFGHISNNLPLDLELITHVSDTH